MNRPWESAAKRGDTAALREQLEDGVSINVLDRHGQSALMIAAREGHLGQSSNCFAPGRRSTSRRSLGSRPQCLQWWVIMKRSLARSRRLVPV